MRRRNWKHYDPTQDGLERWEYVALGVACVLLLVIAFSV